MGGVLSHVALALLSANIVHLIHFRMEYSAAIFLGNLVPDVIKFGVSGLLNGTVNLSRIIKTNSYGLLQPMTDTASSWFTLGFFLLSLSLFLFHYQVVRKKKMEEYDELLAFFIIGVITHLLLDRFYQEPSPWL